MSTCSHEQVVKYAVQFSLYFLPSADCDEELMIVLVIACGVFPCLLIASRLRLSTGNWLCCNRSCSGVGLGGIGFFRYRYSS